MYGLNRLRRDVWNEQAAVQSLKKGKSAGVDNIPTELIQAGGEDVQSAKDLADRRMANPMDPYHHSLTLGSMLVLL